MLQTALERQLYFLVRRWTCKFALCGWWLGGILLKLQGMKMRINGIELEPNAKMIWVWKDEVADGKVVVNDLV